MTVTATFVHGEVTVRKYWRHICLAAVLACGSALADASLYYTPPEWGTPAQTIELPYDTGRTPAENGAVLKAAVLALTAGQRLVVHGGEYYIGSYFGPVLNGEDGTPIMIEAHGSDEVEISSDVNHNILDLNGTYVILRGLSFTGGSIGIRIHSCHHVWLDRCRIHDTPEAALTANTYDTSNLYITDNEIYNTAGTGEGMYLGANYGTVAMHSSVVAGNHVHNTGGEQGDGIELKQGSWGNTIAGNLVHDCNYPCILVYGTAGQPPNVVEGNICYDSNDNVMQVQGEAIVRNNLAVNGAGSAFHTHDHQGQTVNLEVANNTFVNSGRCADLTSWSNRSGMVFANNACYSESAEAIRFPNGSIGVTVTGNVVVGSVTGAASGFITGGSLGSDFQELSYDASRRDARPSEDSSLIGAADPVYLPSTDLTGTLRNEEQRVAGAYDPPSAPPQEPVPATHTRGLCILALALLSLGWASSSRSFPKAGVTNSTES